MKKNQKELYEKLTDLQKKFCDLLLEGESEVDAYISAGGKAKKPENTTRQIMSLDRVKDYLKASDYIAGKRAAGRPTKYREEYCEQAEKLCLLGADDKRLADFFEINVDTLYKWKRDHDQFSEAIKAGKELANANVAHSLYRRAIGVKVTETKFEKGDGGMKKVRTEKELPPDTSAAIFFLKNRDPNWRDKQETEHSGVIGTVGYTPEQYQAMEDRLDEMELD